MCPVLFIDDVHEIPDDAIVLIDNYENKYVFDMELVKNKAKMIFATLTGEIV
jgi:hypothetical protein